MAFETKNFFNSTIKQIYQQTGAILSLSTRSDKQLLINSLKLFEANFVYNWQKIHYPLLHGPTGSPYEKYTGMRSKPWAEYDALDSVYGGISGWTLTAEPWATEDSIPALWDETNKQPHSITGALYYLSQRIEDLTVENDEAELPQYDDREVKADIDCLEKNLETIYKDVYGCGYTLDCDGGKQNQFSVQTHLFQIFDQLIDGGPQFSIDDNCEDLYPAMSIYMPTSGLTYDVKIPNNQVDGVCGNSLQDDLNLIHSYIGLNNCETSPTYSDYGTLNYLSDGTSLEESLWDLDNAIGSFSATKTLLEAYKDGWLDSGNNLPGLIQIKDNANKTNASEGIKIVHPRTNTNWSNPSSIVMVNNNLGTVFEDNLLEIKDEAISGSNYIISPLTNKFGSPDIDRWFEHLTVGEHEVGRKAQIALPNPFKYGDFIYPSFHIYRSVFNQMPTSGVPRTRSSSQTYEGYTSYQMNETAIWVATGLDRDGDSYNDPTYPPAGVPYDCDGNIVSENNLYYRQPSDGTIFLLNKCGMTVQTTSGGGTFAWGEDAPNGAAGFHGLDTDNNNGYFNSTVMFENPDGNGITVGWGGTTDTADDDSAVSSNTLSVQEHYQGDLNKASVEIRSRNTGSKEVISFTHGNFGSVNENASIATSATGDFEFIANGDTRDIVFKPDDTESLRLYSNGNATFSGDVLISGGLVVDGTTTTINSTTLQVDDKNIELGTVSTPTDITANGGGITLKASSDKTFTWNSSDNVWSSNIGLRSNGHVYLAANTSILLDSASGVNAIGSEGVRFDSIYGVGVYAESYIKLNNESGDEGKIKYNDVSNEFEGHNGTSWVSLSNGGSGSGINNVVEDITPQLGGNLDLNSNDINGTGDIDISGTVTADLIKSTLEGSVHFEAQAGEALVKGEVVYVSGISGNTPIVTKARSNSSTTMPAFGIAAEDISLNNSGNIVTFGSQTGLDVSDFGETGITFSLGDTVYVSSSEAGRLTNIAPAGESNLIQNIGKIERATPTTNMTIKVGGAGRSNATPALNNGNIFIGDSNNRAVTTSLQTEVESYSINSLTEDASPQLGGNLDANGNDIDMGTNVITDTAVGQWNTAYGWGDHSGAGYLTSIDLNGLTGTTGTVSKFAIVSSGLSRTITPANIDISIFNNDVGYVTTDTTYTAGTGLGLTGTTFNLATAGIGAGTYGSASDGTKIDEITVDAYGRVTNITTGTVDGGGSGTVTSITPDADTGTGTAITTSGTITIAGGENVETEVLGTTVTINAPRTFGSIAFDMDSGDANPGRNIHSSGNLSVFNETQIQLIRSGSTDNRVQFNVDKGYSVGDVITITNNIEGNVYFEAVAVDTFSNSPTLQSKFQGYYPAVNVGGNNECQFGNITSTSLNTYEIIIVPGNGTIKLYCSDVTSGSATFEVYKA
jgi:hypothetical protein